MCREKGREMEKRERDLLRERTEAAGSERMERLSLKAILLALFWLFSLFRNSFFPNM